jgi:asparagine synthase (glutamine-hydrolysing)
MCGIFGAIGRDPSAATVDRVLDILHHRGPDDQGRFSDPSVKVTLGHTRLAVIDLATGAQPLHSQDGDIVLVCNGEIYDFERLRSALEENMASPASSICAASSPSSSTTGPSG